MAKEAFNNFQEAGASAFGGHGMRDDTIIGFFLLAVALGIAAGILYRAIRDCDDELTVDLDELKRRNEWH